MQVHRMHDLAISLGEIETSFATVWISIDRKPLQMLEIKVKSRISYEDIKDFVAYLEVFRVVIASINASILIARLRD